jgi:hypothetical protein
MYKACITVCLFSILVFSCQSCSNLDYRPQNFEEIDLVGTWEAVYGNNRVDNLIVKQDRTYKQIYNEPNGYSYESPWNSWYVEYRDKGGVYLHLQGMRFYPLGREWSQDDAQNLFSELQPFYDPDEDRSVKMQGEVILRIHKSDERWSPRGIILVHMVTDPDSSGASFTLQE